MWIHLLALELIDGAGGEVTPETPTVGGGYDDEKTKKPAKKRFVVERDGKLLVFNTAQAALDAQPKKKKIQPVEVVAEPEVKTVELPKVRQYAAVLNRIEEYNTAYNGKHYEALIAMFTTMQAQALKRIQDEEDIQLLLLA